MRKTLRIIVSAVLMTGVLIAQPMLSYGAGTSSAQFLKLGAGAKAAAMGNAFTAVADDVTATYWNPAGLAQMESPQISVMQNNWLVDSQYQYLGAGLPLSDGAIGLSLYRVDHGNIDRYTAADTRDGSFQAGSLAGALTLSQRKMDVFFYGLTIKFLRETLENESASSFAADLGFLLKTGIMRFALAYQNLGPQMKFVQDSAPLPQSIKLGASAELFPDKLLCSVEAVKPNDNDITLHTGVDFRVTKFVNVRGGYQVTPSNKLDVGGLAGLSGGIGVQFGRFRLDYAFLPFGDLGNSQILSLQIDFLKS